MENTLYYTLSTIAQVEIAIVALSGIFLFFHIQKIYDIQIGQGKASIAWKEKYFANRIIERYSNPNTLKVISDEENMFVRLGDAVHRRNIFGVEEFLLYRAIEEIEKKLNNGPYSAHLLPKFIETNRILKKSSIAAGAIILSGVLCILFSVISLALMPSIVGSTYEKSTLWLNVTFFCFNIIFAISAILWMYFSKLPFEKHKIETNRTLMKRYLDWQATTSQLDISDHEPT